MKLFTRLMANIKSYIFLDLETTGLPGHNYGNTKVTELTFLAVIKDHFYKDLKCIPRAINKITLCINPLNHISYKSSEVTGLSNDLLDDFQSFNEDCCDMLISFVKSVPQPVCFLAHNGDNFDFPILQSQMKIKLKEFPETVMCGDTLKAFRNLRVMEKESWEWHSPEKRMLDEWDELNLGTISSILDEVELACKQFDTETEDSKKKEPPGYCTPTKKTDSSEPKTPPKQGVRPDSRLEVTPEGKKHSPKQVPSGAKRQLYKRAVSYKLGAVHKHVTGQELMNAHSSEADVIGLLNIVTILQNPFHEWISSNCKPFKEILKIW